MMHLEALIERNRKPTPNYTDARTPDLYRWRGAEARHRLVMKEAVSPMASIDGAMAEDEPTLGDMLKTARESVRKAV